MIATISPVDANFDESLSTLKYANRAKQIVNNAKKNDELKAAAVDCRPFDHASWSTLFTVRVLLQR